MTAMQKYTVTHLENNLGGNLTPTHVGQDTIIMTAVDIKNENNDIISHFHLFCLLYFCP